VPKFYGYFNTFAGLVLGIWELASDNGLSGPVVAEGAGAAEGGSGVEARKRTKLDGLDKRIIDLDSMMCAGRFPEALRAIKP